MKIILENKESAKIAAEFLQQGQIIAFATDTVYGLAVDACNDTAIEKLYSIKKRNKSKPLAVFLPNLEMAKKIFEFSYMAKKIAQKFLPGALTLVLKKRPQALVHLSSKLNENDDFLGFRIVDRDFFYEIFKHFKNPIAVTSANITDQAAFIDADSIKNHLPLQNIDLLIDGGICEKKIPSTVVKIIDEKIIILRQGSIDSNLINSVAQ